MLSLEEYKLAQQAILQSLAAAEKDAIRAKDQVEEVAIAAGAMSMEDTLAAIKVDDNSDALINVIPLKDGDDLNKKGDEDSQEDKLED